ncbi:MAG TPA: hypothetical protein ACFCUD_01610 [Cyclobacteriaceae bacterium]
MNIRSLKKVFTCTANAIDLSGKTIDELKSIKKKSITHLSIYGSVVVTTLILAISNTDNPEYYFMLILFPSMMPFIEDEEKRIRAANRKLKELTEKK